MKLLRVRWIRVLSFIAGLLLVLYPPVSNRWNNRVQADAILAYQVSVSGTDGGSLEEMLAGAEEYNRELNQVFFPLAFHEQVYGYDDLLNLQGSGMMGILHIEKIGVSLPIYHMDSGQVPAKAVGHLPGSSLPVGGEGTHSVLCAHCGRLSAKLFTDLYQLREGERFTLTVLNRVLTYKVDQIRIVDAKDVSQTETVTGKDYCTLMTCVPGWLNNQRMLVRGIRVEPEQTAPGAIRLRDNG